MLRTMLRGQMGPDIQAIQDALNIRTPGLTLQPDGKFGPKTEAAVKDFQRRNRRLKPDGIVGPRTRSVLYPLVATTLNLVGTKNKDLGGLRATAGIIPKLGALGPLQIPKMSRSVQGNTLSPPPGPRLKLDSFQLNPGGQVSFANLGESPQATFSLGLQSLFKRGEDDGRLELALGLQLGSPLFLRASDGSDWTFSWFANFTWVDPLGKLGLFHFWSPFATVGEQSDNAQVSAGAALFPVNVSLDIIPDKLNISVNSGVAGTLDLRSKEFTWSAQTTFGVGGSFTLF